METHSVPGKATQIIVIAAPEVSSLKVAGLGLLERWKKVGEKLTLTVIPVEMQDLARLLESVSSPLFLTHESAVVEELALETLLEGEIEPFEAVIPASAKDENARVIGLGARTARMLSEKLAAREYISMQEISKLLEENEGVFLRETKLSGSFRGIVTDKRSAKKATRGLAASLRMRPGGFVAQFVNRPISLRITRYILNTSISPNQVTLFAAILGAFGIFFIFLGGWRNAVIGTGLMQLNSIIDGVDGEIARLKYQTSEFGAYLDSVCDEILNAAMMVAIGYYLWQEGEWVPYLYMGIFTGLISISYALVHWHCKWKHGLGFYWWFESYKPRVAVQRSTSPFSYIKKLFWKESLIFIFFILALFNMMQIMLFVCTAGALVVLILFFIHIPVKQARW